MTALPQSGTFVMVDPTHVREVGMIAAAVYARILWRNQHGPWRSTRAGLAAELGITTGALRTAVQVLRDRDWITTTRASSKDATLVWAPVLPGQPEVADIAAPPCSIEHDPPAGSATSSYETGRDQLETHAASVVGDDPVPLFVVPEPVPETVVEVLEDAGPPKSAQTLVARWCDGYRDANAGADAPKPFMGRVAGQARNLAKACGDDHASWVAAYHAAFAAGRAGVADMTSRLVQREASKPRSRNHLLDLGGQGDQAMAAMLDRPAPFPSRALGGSQ